jgi:hypothetical protein
MTFPRDLPLFRWTRHSSILLAAFLLTVLLIVYIWRPLAEEYLAYVDWSGPWWLYIDWLLIGIFAFMSLTIVSNADLRSDALIVFVGACGGLAIESWGTQTNLWFYYTSERPPLWILPAWPIASLAIDRIARLLLFVNTKAAKERAGGTRVSFVFVGLYWLICAWFLALMLVFVAPTFDKPYTILSTLLCLGVILTPTDHRFATLTFLAGAALGYYLELWGTTRQCWTYYTYETPPLFAVLAHGMAAVIFWRAGLLLKTFYERFTNSRPRLEQSPTTDRRHGRD